MLRNHTVIWCCLSLVIGLCFMGNASRLTADDLADRFEARVFAAPNGYELKYRLLAPASIKRGEHYPVVLFLHGAGERGDDNAVQLVHVVKELATDEMQQRYPCYVIVPQCPKEQKWVEVDWKLPSSQMPETPSVPLAAVKELLGNLHTALPIDRNRIYVCGLSMGGYGTWDCIQRWPEQFAAAIPICGGGDPAYAQHFAQIPVWVFHGDADNAVNVNRSREMVCKLRELGSDVIYTEYPGVGHDSWTVTAKNRLTWDWLFAQQKKEE